VKSINNDIEATLLSLEDNLVETSPYTEKFQKQLILRVIKKRHTDRYLAQQRRIKALRSPISTAISTFHTIFGGEKQEQEEEEIDTSLLEKDFEVTQNILESLSFRESINFFNESMKHGLKRTNSIWIKKLDI
jgi:hypothetical protein